jgi:hypothetical protein
MKVSSTFGLAGGGVGYTVALKDQSGNGVNCRYLSLYATSECYIQPVYVAPGGSAPAIGTAALIPASGAATNTVHIGTSALPAVEIDWSKGQPDGSGPPVGSVNHDIYTHLVVWNVSGAAAGELAILGN